mmetsp:Transcript_118309/g.329982  ORF Transcript_118309/g.329982 Transcript_118309/m.329982 type:complete len:94 (-) Transcript_118309:63-344(-)
MIRCGRVNAAGSAVQPVLRTGGPLDRRMTTDPLAGLSAPLASEPTVPAASNIGIFARVGTPLENGVDRPVPLLAYTTKLVQCAPPGKEPERRF